MQESRLHWFGHAYKWRWMYKKLLIALKWMVPVDKGNKTWDEVVRSGLWMMGLTKEITNKRDV